MELRTERLLLRPPRADDLAAIHTVLSDARAMAYWSSPPHTNVDQSREWLDKMIAVDLPEGEEFIVELDGTVIGKAGLWRFPEIGFILRSDHWGRGLAKEALGAVLDRAFNVHGLSRVEADVDPRNERSLRLLGGLGFSETARKERTWLVGDCWCDSVYLELRCGDWVRPKERT